MALNLYISWSFCYAFVKMCIAAYFGPAPPKGGHHHYQLRLYTQPGPLDLANAPTSKGPWDGFPTWLTDNQLNDMAASFQWRTKRKN